jgi:hypothetical protein
VENSQSLLDQPLPNPNNFDPRYTHNPYHPSSSTEIRIKVNTVGDTVSEEVYERTLPVPEDGESEYDAENSQPWGETSSNIPPASTTDSFSSRNSAIGESVPSFADFSCKGDIATDADSVVEQSISQHEPVFFEPQETDEQNKTEFPSEELQLPMDLHITKLDHPELGYFDDPAFSSSQSRGLWKVVCCNVGKKIKKDGDLVNQLRREDAAEVFPATRMIANGQSQYVTGDKVDLVNGVMGVPSDHFLDAKGPQSLYAYDYESHEHMDVQYTEMGQRSRSSISVRSLGPPPSLSASSGGDHVVIQVEVRIVFFFSGDLLEHQIH